MPRRSSRVSDGSKKGGVDGSTPKAEESSTTTSEDGSSPSTSSPSPPASTTKRKSKPGAGGKKSRKRGRDDASGAGSGAGGSGSAKGSSSEGQSSSGAVPAFAFLRKSHAMLDDPENVSSVSWNKDGTAIMIHNLDTFSNNVLPKYFKHNNYSSFVRQLNMYGFTKVADPSVREFAHPMFRRGRLDLLANMKRKVAGSATPAFKKGVQEMQQAVEELQSLRQRQQELEQTVLKLKAESNQQQTTNQELWSQLQQSNRRHVDMQNKMQNMVMMMYRMFRRLTGRDNPQIMSHLAGAINGGGRNVSYLLDGSAEGSLPPSPAPIVDGSVVSGGSVSPSLASAVGDLEVPPSPTFTSPQAFRNVVDLMSDSFDPTQPAQSGIDTLNHMLGQDSPHGHHGQRHGLGQPSHQGLEARTASSNPRVSAWTEASSVPGVTVETVETVPLARPRPVASSSRRPSPHAVPHVVTPSVSTPSFVPWASTREQPKLILPPAATTALHTTSSAPSALHPAAAALPHTTAPLPHHSAPVRIPAAGNGVGVAMRAGAGVGVGAAGPGTSATSGLGPGSTAGFLPSASMTASMPPGSVPLPFSASPGAASGVGTVPGVGSAGVYSHASGLHPPLQASSAVPGAPQVPGSTPLYASSPHTAPLPSLLAPHLAHASPTGLTPLLLGTAGGSTGMITPQVSLPPPSTLPHPSPKRSRVESTPSYPSLDLARDEEAFLTRLSSMEGDLASEVDADGDDDGFDIYGLLTPSLSNGLDPSPPGSASATPVVATPSLSAPSMT